MIYAVDVWHIIKLTFNRYFFGSKNLSKFSYFEIMLVESCRGIKKYPNDSPLLYILRRKNNHDSISRVTNTGLARRKGRCSH